MNERTGIESADAIRFTLIEMSAGLTEIKLRSSSGDCTFDNVN
jgi:hypothetical protein